MASDMSTVESNTSEPVTEEPIAEEPASEQRAEAETTNQTPSPTATNTRVATNTPIPPTSTSTPTPAPTEEPELIEVDENSSTKVNVRSGPGTNYPVIDQLDPGEDVPVTGFNFDSSWWQIDLGDVDDAAGSAGWVYAEIVQFRGDINDLTVAEAPPPPPTATPAPIEPATASEDEAPPQPESAPDNDDPTTPEDLTEQLKCDKDFCITYQAMVPIWENGGCIGNHSIFVTVLEGPPPGRPLDGIVIGDTFGNVEVASGAKGPGAAEFTLWMNTMAVKVKRHIDGTEFTSEESFPFTSHDELIPAEVLAANGYCDGRVETCRVAQQQNQVCRGHYSWKVTFHKFD